MKSLGGLCSVQAPLVQTNCAKSVRVWHTGSDQALQLDRKFFDEIDLTKPCHLTEVFLQRAFKYLID